MHYVLSVFFTVSLCPAPFSLSLLPLLLRHPVTPPPALDGPSSSSSSSPPHHALVALSKTHVPILLLFFYLLSLSLCFSACLVESTSSQDGPGRWLETKKKSESDKAITPKKKTKQKKTSGRRLKTAFRNDAGGAVSSISHFSSCNLSARQR